MKGKILGIKKKNGARSLHKTSKQISKTKIMTKLRIEEGEFKCVLDFATIDKIRDLKMASGLSYATLFNKLMDNFVVDKVLPTPKTVIQTPVKKEVVKPKNNRPSKLLKEQDFDS